MILDTLRPRIIACNSLPVASGDGLILEGATGQSNLAFTQYLLVHELGHVLTNRSRKPNSTSPFERETGLLFAAVQGTFSGICSQIFSPSDELEEGSDPFADLEFSLSKRSRIHDARLEGGLVMGRRTGFPENVSWTRGERGWGSGPDNVFTSFQQHPVEVFPNDDDIAAVDEAAADLFLNWVYRAIWDRPPTYKEVVPGFWEGFRNTSWIDNSPGSDDPNYPGDARFEWMNSVMNRVFIVMNWQVEND